MMINKKNWPAGPWDGEPDREEWRDKATGLPCLIVRNRSGALCGYVGVPPGHPWHGQNYHDVNEDVNVHGGLTYSDFCDEYGEICHVPQPGEPENVWWLGFDTAHGGDLPPALAAEGLFSWMKGTYRDMAYVRQEVTNLAAQVAKEGTR